MTNLTKEQLEIMVNISSKVMDMLCDIMNEQREKIRILTEENEALEEQKNHAFDSGYSVCEEEVKNTGRTVNYTIVKE